MCVHLINVILLIIKTTADSFSVQYIEEYSKYCTYIYSIICLHCARIHTLRRHFYSAAITQQFILLFYWIFSLWCGCCFIIMIFDIRDMIPNCPNMINHLVVYIIITLYWLIKRHLKLHITKSIITSLIRHEAHSHGPHWFRSTRCRKQCEICKPDCRDKGEERSRWKLRRHDTFYWNSICYDSIHSNDPK